MLQFDYNEKIISFQDNTSNFDIFIIKKNQISHFKITLMRAPGFEDEWNGIHDEEGLFIIEISMTNGEKLTFEDVLLKSDSMGIPDITNIY
jgi:hypothetical protein